MHLFIELCFYLIIERKRKLFDHDYFIRWNCIKQINNGQIDPKRSSQMKKKTNENNTENKVAEKSIHKSMLDVVNTTACNDHQKLSVK